MARILIFHGYLLEGTGSNVYNARLAQTLARLGHDVHLVCQERHPERLGFVDAAGDWDSGTLRVRRLREPAAGAGVGAEAGSCTVYRPDIGGLLPVYVADRYEAMEARTFSQLSDGELRRYLEANVDAVREVAARAGPELALANHLVMGPVILARALGTGIPYAVKVHGSALEYTVKPDPERFLGVAREGLAPAAAVLVGSRHTAESLWEAIADPGLPGRTRLGPPGVDVARFRPRGKDEAIAGVADLADALRHARELRPAGGESAFAREPRQAGDALARVRGGEPLVAFVGKLIVSKGPDLLLAAWPLVLERLPCARLLIVGFGAYREGLEAMAGALRAGDLERVRELALAGRALEGGGEAKAAPLGYLLAFLDSLDGPAAARYVAAAGEICERALFTGRLEHDELPRLLPACSALVVPSTFPEAFGMVAAEAAACGALPISAAHSGLAEVSETLAASVPAPIRPLLSFDLGPGVVPAIARRVLAWLECEPALQERTRDALVATVRARWSWESVAEGVIAAARGELEVLPEP
ncbi:MAG TPA: glycosyltransferase [Solirubrobacteraceae bacterium]|nr:glycosyltransferase [Solirubrobacteraceae bacterium]